MHTGSGGTATAHSVWSCTCALFAQHVRAFSTSYTGLGRQLLICVAVTTVVELEGGRAGVPLAVLVHGGGAAGGGDAGVGVGGGGHLQHNTHTHIGTHVKRSKKNREKYETHVGAYIYV